MEVPAIYTYSLNVGPSTYMRTLLSKLKVGACVLGVQVYEWVKETEYLEIFPVWWPLETHHVSKPFQSTLLVSLAGRAGVFLTLLQTCPSHPPTIP